MKKIGIKFWQLGRRADAIYRMNMEGNFIARGMQTYIIKIVESPGLIQDEISKTVKVDKGTATRAVQRLLKKGYITRERDKKDKRKYRIYPTELAKEEYPRIIEEYKKITETALEGLNEKEQELLEELLEKVYDNLNSKYEELKDK